MIDLLTLNNAMYRDPLILNEELLNISMVTHNDVSILNPFQVNVPLTAQKIKFSIKEFFS